MWQAIKSLDLWFSPSASDRHWQISSFLFWMCLAKPSLPRRLTFWINSASFGSLPGGGSDVPGAVSFKQKALSMVSKWCATNEQLFRKRAKEIKKKLNLLHTTIAISQFIILTIFLQLQISRKNYMNFWTHFSKPPQNSHKSIQMLQQRLK